MGILLCYFDTFFSERQMLAQAEVRSVSECPNPMHLVGEKETSEQRGENTVKGCLEPGRESWPSKLLFVGLE